MTRTRLRAPKLVIRREIRYAGQMRSYLLFTLFAFATLSLACGDTAGFTLDAGTDDADLADVSAPLELRDTTVSVLEDESASGSLEGSASITPTCTLAVTTPPAHGSLLLGPGLAYTYTPAADFAGTDLAVVTATCGARTASATVSVTVTPVNDAPTVIAPSALETYRDVPFIFDGASSISVDDVDVGSSPLSVSLRAENATFDLATVTGLSFSEGDGVADAELAFTGPVTAIAAALDGLALRPDAQFVGEVTWTLSVDDQGASPAPARQTSVTATLHVVIPDDMVNQPPLLRLIGRADLSPPLGRTFGAAVVETVCLRLDQGIGAIALGFEVVDADPPPSQTDSFVITVTRPDDVQCNVLFATPAAWAAGEHGTFTFSAPFDAVVSELAGLGVECASGAPIDTTLSLEISDAGYIGACSPTEPMSCAKTASAVLHVEARAGVSVADPYAGACP